MPVSMKECFFFISTLPTRKALCILVWIDILYTSNHISGILVLGEGCFCFVLVKMHSTEGVHFIQHVSNFLISGSDHNLRKAI